MSCVIDEPDVALEFAADSRSQRALEALELLIACDIESMNRADLDSVVRARRAVVALCDAVDIRVARRSRQLAAEGRSEPPADVLRDKGRRSGREAAAAAGREKICEKLPSFEAALAEGTVSSGHLDALTNAMSKLDESATAEFVTHEEDLLNAARGSSVEAFERHCRDDARSVADDDGSSELERQRGEPRQVVDRQAHRDGPPAR